MSPSTFLCGIESTVGGLIGILWPHTFKIKGGNIGADGKYVHVVRPGFETTPAALPPAFREAAQERASVGGIPANEIGNYMRGVSNQIGVTHAARRATLREKFGVNLPNPIPPDFFVNDTYRDARLQIDIATMELFSDRWNELCPCCYVSLKSDREYVRYTERKGKVCASHIFSEHYLKNIDVALAIDTRQPKLVTAHDNMSMDLLCTVCDNKQGSDWEALICKREPCCSVRTCDTGPCYMEPSYPFWKSLVRNLCLPDGSAVSMRLNSERSFFRFLVPNIFRACLLGINVSNNIYTLYSDALRQYMHVHLDTLFAGKVSAVVTHTAKFNIYVFTITQNILPALLLRWKSVHPTMKIRDALKLVIYSTIVREPASIGLLMNPFVICLSTEDIPDFAPFLIEDLDRCVNQKFPCEEDSTAISFISMVLHKALESEQKSAQFLTSSRLKEKDAALTDPKHNVELPPPIRFVILICGYIKSRKATGLMSDNCSRFYKATLTQFDSLDVLLERNLLSRLINKCDTDVMRESCRMYYKYAQNEVQELLAIYDSL
eukprot:CAMPEP_0184998986 /NCGR_PEP_ID=MMETSP1098-20130426/64122_1 /TAXON_ID=89044 /ORGANISM="Spumella elongata, Strain CCAP 955/1" /LENGTH=548 /DNA_ID=CAMNT_0027525917 /DNA_START=172 /DNA_END=1818 /DNA_ORIENTATION=-